MSAERIDGVIINKEVFIENDIVYVSYDFEHVKKISGRIDKINDDFLYLDQSSNFKSKITKISMKSIVAIVKVNE